jgi:FKBP-type peptidyl-prolyl cis-trans isomerase 2
MIVELANGSLAVVVGLSEDTVKLDANNMMAGKTLTFELEVVSIDKGSEEASANNGDAGK